MPNYKVNGKTYTIPDNEVDLFESDFPEAELHYQTNDGKKYTILANERKDFLTDFPDATELGWNQQPEKEETESKQNDSLVQPMYGSMSYEENISKSSDGAYYPSPLSEEGRADYEPISAEERSKQEYDMLMRQLDEFNAANGSFMDTYEAYEKAAKHQINEGGFALDTMEREYLDANSNDYHTRKQERDALNDRIRSNSYFNQMRMAESDAANEAADGIANLAAQERAANHKLDLQYNLWNMQHQMPYSTGPSVKRALSPEALEHGNAQADLQAAERLYRKTAEIYAAPVNNGEDILKNFAVGAGQRAGDLDFWTMGLSAIEDDINARQAFQKIQDKLGSVKELGNLTEAELDELITPEEQILINAFMDNIQAQAARQYNTSGAYKAGQGAADSAMFMAQFLLTGGIGEAATAGTQVHKNVVNWLGRKLGTMSNGLMKDVARGAVKLGIGTAESIGKALVMTPLMPHTYANIADKIMSFDDNGELMNVTDAIIAGASDALIETWSESTGDFVNKVLGVPGDILKGGAQKVLKNVDFSDWGNAMNAPLMKILRKGGFNGFLGEMGEEFIGNAIRSVVGRIAPGSGLDPNAFNEFVQLENLLVTAGSFAPMTILGLGGSAAQFGWQKRQLANAQSVFENILREGGYTEDQVKFAVDELLGSTDAHLTPERLVEKFSPMLRELAYNDRFSENKVAAVDSAVKFMWEIARYRAFDGIYHRQEEQQKNDMLAEIQEGTGREFWTTRLSEQAGLDGTAYETDEVRAVEFKDGRVAYVLGGDGVTNTVVYNDGQTGFLSEEQLNEGKATGNITSDATMGLNDYLTQQVARVRMSAEEIRMFEERNSNIGQIREQFPVGAAVQMGTAEAPMEGVVLQQTPDGVVVQAPDNTTRLLTWEELGHTIGIEATPQTDAQQDEETINNLEIADLQRRREREQRRAQRNVAAETALEEEQQLDETENEEIEHPIPTRADGSVDQTALWNESPARWAQWKTEQRQDGGAYASSYIQNAIGILEGQIAESEAAFLAESDFDAKDALEQTINQQRARLAELQDLAMQYMPSVIPAETSAEQAPAVMAERQKFELDEEYQRRLSLARALAEKEMILKEYFEAISAGSMEAVVMNKQNYKQVMKDLGCSEADIQEVADAIKIAEKNKQAVNALHANGKVFIIAEYNSTVENGRLSYVHERQHNITKRRPEFVQKILSLGLGREKLQNILTRLTGTTFYNDKSDEVLADEIISATMEVAYTYDDLFVTLSKFGLPIELINILNEINDEQRNDYTLVNARRNQIANNNAETSGGENVGDQGEVSGGVLGTEGEGSLEDSERRAGNGEPADRAESREVNASDDENVPLPIAEEAELDPETILNEDGFEIDEQNEDVRFSVRYLPTPDQREGIINSIIAVTGRTRDEAERWLDSELSLASIVLNDKEYLDYAPDAKYKAIKDNSDYPQGTVDFNNICRKRKDFTRMYTRLQRSYPNRIFTAEDLADIRTIMSEDGLTVACGLCYVEDRRQKLGEVANAFIEDLQDGFRNYAKKGATKKANAVLFTILVSGDAYIPSIYDLITLEGSDKLYEEHRGIWEAFGAYNRARGQQTQNTFQGYAEYKREILTWSDAKVKKVNSLGGLRIFSYSDFEAHHLLDIIQIIIDCAARGVMIQGYTKVPEFARVVEKTGIKLNRSLIPLGDTGIVDGKLAYDPVEGIDINDPNFLESNDNVGNILIGINDEQIRMAMVDPFIHYIIPYHARQAGNIRAKLNVGAWTNYIDTQNERKISDGKRVEKNINIYTDVLNESITNDREFVEKYLEVCREKEYIPKFDQFLDKDAEGNYVYTPGYYKFLVDFKLFDEAGNILPQKAVVAEFDDAFNAQVLNDYAREERETTGNQMNSTYDKIVETLDLGEPTEGEDVQFRTSKAPIDILEEARKVVEREDANSKVSFRITPEQDKAYMDAVEAGDMETAQRMVVEAAKLAMPNTKVVDEEGNPKVVYHQTNAKVYINRETGQNWDDLNWKERMEWDERDDWENYWEEQDFNTFSRTNARTTNEFDGFFFAPNFDEHHEYGDRTIAAFVNIQNPASREDYNIDATQNNAGRNERIRLQEAGFDGVIRMDGEEVDEYIAFSPNQIKSAEPVTYDNDGNVILLSERFNPENEDIRFRVSNDNQAIFVSNAAKAVEGIKQEKATPEQWLKMLEKAGGLKAGEDKWMGLSDWLKASDKKTLTKQEVLDFINENMIIIEEQHYSDEEVAASANKELNDKYPGWDEAFSMDWDSYMDEPYASIWDNETAVELYNNNHEDQIELDEDGEFENLDDESKVMDFGKEIAEIYYRGNSDVRPIHGTRSDYQTRGLSDNHEIALTVPTIERWKADDAVHFGDAGDGRAIAWIRFGETKYRPAGIADEIAALDKAILEYEGETSDEEYKALVNKKHALLRASRAQKVLVIDEIQSNRHQEGREKGYKPAIDVRARLNEIAKRLKELGKIESTSTSGLTDEQHEERDKLLDEEIRLIKAGPIPDAPFDKNWHELAMKRMLRYAAENGYDVIAWTTGDQQARRYDLSRDVLKINAYKPNAEGEKIVTIYYRDEYNDYKTLVVNREGKVVQGDYNGSALSEVVGKEMALQIMNAEEVTEFAGEGLKIGGEGMKGFYDKMLPAFMNKYGKKWGVKVEDIDLPNLGKSGYTMHSVPVTEEMKASVIEGQVMFRVRGDNESAIDFHKDTLIDFKRNFNTPKPTTVVDVNDRNAVAEALGYTPEEFTDKMYQQIVDGVNDGGKSLYDAGKKRIAIFAIEDSRRSADVEENIFHENTHGIIAEHPELLELGEWLWDNSQPRSRQQIKQSILDSGYYEGQYHNEMLSRYTGLVLAKGMAGAVMQKLPADQQKHWELILNEFGYEPEREDGNRRRRFESDTRGMGTPGYGQEHQQEVSDNGASETRFRTTEITPEVQAEMDVISATALMDGTYLKAPNGADTNLTAEQWAMVRTKNFKAWFGDWENDPENASKVVDENGEPKVVFHGGAWRPLLEEKGNAVFKMRGGLMGKGAYFTDTLSTAIDYAREKYGWEHDEEVSDEFLDDNGYVTEVFLNIRNEDNIREYYGETYYLATNFSQIKSAVANTGEFSQNFDIRFKVVTDPAKIEELENGPKVKVYRAMQLIDGKLYPPMSAKVDGQLRQPIELGQWEEAEERPDLADDKGYFKLDKGNKKSLKARYNPYFHTSYTPLNDQFSEAQDRPNLVTVEVEIPASELTSGYKADKAKDSVGEKEWKAGVIQGKLSGTRKVILSRWDKPVRIVPDSEVADVIVKMFEGKDIVMPSNVVTPSLREELEKRGVPFVETNNKGKKLQFTRENYEDIPQSWYDSAEQAQKAIELNGVDEITDRHFKDYAGSVILPSPSKALAEKILSGDKKVLIKKGIFAKNEAFHDFTPEQSRKILNDALYTPNRYGQTQPISRPLNWVAIKTGDRNAIIVLEVNETKDYLEIVSWHTLDARNLRRIERQAKREGGEILILDSEESLAASLSALPSDLSSDGKDTDNLETTNDSEENISLRVTGTPTDEVVASGLNLSPAQTAELAGNIFAALPEDSRKKITDGLNGDFLGIQDAIMQIPASLAMKEEWDEEDRATADIVASEVTKMAGDMTRPFSAPEALWVLYNELNKSDDLISQASRVIVQRNLGFDKQTQDTIAEAKDGVRFRTVGDANINATASMYNKGAVNVWTRLKESYVDMHASIEELVKAIEKASGKEAQGFENILMALNQQSSKGLAAMESYEKKFLEPMYKAIRNIMDATDFRYEDIVRYVILKHGLERNEKMAQRDAKAHYQEIYDEIISKIKGMNPAQKRTYLTNAQLRDADAKAELARLQGVNTTALTPDQLKDYKKELAKAKKEAADAAEHLVRAQKIATMTEQDAQDELDKIFKKIEKGTDSVYKEMRKNDYSGLTSMFYRQLGVNRKDYETEEEYQAALMQAKQDKYATLADVENAAEMEVLGFENEISTTELWERINKATKETLRQQYESNMISKDQYETLRDMFQFYVPLRGFKDNTAEDMYTYYRKPNSTGYTKPILGAEGRKTEAESPFGWIAAMAGSAIASNVKNEAKLALYYFVSNRPDNGVATISRTWFVDSGEVDADGKRIFKPAYPPFTEDLSSDAAKAAYEQWQDNMRQLRDKGQAYESGQRLNLGNAVVNISDTNKPEHIVNVKVGGKDYTILINGNPRAAQAINGDLNIEATASDYSALFGPVLRWMSSVNTSYNPEFWITNMMRDMAFTMMAVNIKEDPAYRRKFKKNYAKAFKVISLVAKNEKGTIGNSYIEQQYKDFVKYGGVTGYTQIKDNETWEKEIESYLSSNDPESIKNGKIMKGIKGAAHAMHRFGESLEQVSRFAAFLTARETGKSINEAINDAKEITVNFNRKGSGKMITLEEAKHLTDKHGRPLSKPKQWMAVALSSMAPLGRRTIMFFNAAIQGLNATYKLMKKNPGRFAGWALGYAAVGMMNAVLHAMLDDDDDYLDIPQYERRNSLMIGGNGAYFKWALPQEARAFYALGDLAVETVMGRNPHQSFAGEAGKIMTEILPINPAEGWKAFMPSVAIPFIELALNEDYKGDAIYYDQKWLSKEEKKRTAKWSSAAQGTGAVYKTIAKGLNFATGGDEFDAGWINIQPEKIEHLVQSAFGGTIRTADKFVSTILAAIDPEEDVTVRQFPFLNRFLTINDERYRNVHVNDVFEYYQAEAEHARTLEKKYNKARDAEALKELRQRDEYKWAKIYDKYKKPIKNVQEKIKVADGTEERKDLMKQQDELKKRMIKEISELE